MSLSVPTNEQAAETVYSQPLDCSFHRLGVTETLLPLTLPPLQPLLLAAGFSSLCATGPGGELVPPTPQCPFQSALASLKTPSLEAFLLDFTPSLCCYRRTVEAIPLFP